MPATFRSFTTANSQDMANGATLTLNKPSGVVAGDLLIVFICQDRDATVKTGIPAPSGWTKVDYSQPGAATQNGVQAVYTRVAQAGDPSSWGWVNTSGGVPDTHGTMIAVQDTDGTLAAAPTWQYSSANGTAYTAPSVTGVDDGLLVCGFFRSDNANATASFTLASPLTERVDYAVASSWTGLAVGTEDLTAAGATGTKTATNTDSARWTTVSLVVAPAASGAGDVAAIKATATAQAHAPAVVGYNQTTATLTDDFAADNRATKWPGTYGTTAVLGGVATVTTTGPTNYAGLQSATTAYDLTGSYVKVKMTTPSAGYAAMTLTNAGTGNDICAYWVGGTLSLGVRTGYTFGTPGTLAVTAGNSVYIGIGEGVAGAAHFGGTGTAGNTYWFTSPDGSTWTQRKTAATPSYANDVTILLEAGEAAATTTYDDFNVASGTPANVSAVTATATATAPAPAATAAASVTAVRAQATATALSPAVGGAAGVAGQTATATATGAAPAVTAAAVVLAVRAQATATGQAPSVTSAATAIAPTATATAVAIAPAVAAGGSGQVSAVKATATAAAAAPVVTSASNIAATSGTATAGMQAPAVTTGVSITAVMATATAQAHAPGVTATANGQVNPPAAIMTATALAPELHLSAVVLAPAATATGAGVPPTVTALRAAAVTAPLLQATMIAFAPVVTQGATIAAPTATASGTMPAPAVYAAGSGDVNAVRAQATASAFAPSVAAAAVIAAVRATATALAVTPAVTGEVRLDAPRMQGTGLLRIPAVTAGAVVQVPTATALARPYAPHVLTIDMSDVVLAGRPLVRRWLPVGLRDTYEAEGLADRFTGTYVPVSPKYDTQEIPDRFVGGLVEGETMSVEVLVSAGAVKYVGGTVTETAGLDISGAVFEMSLGSATDPGATWVTPSVSAAGTSNAQRVLKLLVSSTLPAGITWPGTYWCWARITASPEIEPVRLQGPITVR